VGLYFVHWELMGLLWFAIAVMSCEWQDVLPSHQ